MAGDFLANGILGIAFWVIGLFIFYRVIYAAVKNGIDNSVLGEKIEGKQKTNIKKKSSLYDDFED